LSAGKKIIVFFPADKRRGAQQCVWHKATTITNYEMWAKPEPKRRTAVRLYE